MRIGIFTDTYPPYINGVSTSILMLENALKKLGHKVYIITVNPESYKYMETSNMIKLPGIKTGIYDYRLTNIYSIKAIDKIKKWKLDVIHSHSEFGVGTFSRFVGKQLHIPIVHTYHTMYEDYVHYITHGHFKKTSVKLVEYFTKFYCDKSIEELIVPTKKTYDLFKDKYKYTRDVHIIPTGIEIDRFNPINNDIKKINKLKEDLNIKDNKVILYVGRVAEEKSIDFLIENHTNILKVSPNTLLVIVGDGPDIDNYKKLAIKKGIEDKVIFTGKVAWQDIPLYYNIADIFVTASHTETQGLTVIEAMAASKPVVALNDESFNKTVIHGGTGYLFKDKKEYVRYILEILNNDNLRSNMSSEALATSVKYSSEMYAKRVLEVYKLAIKDKKEKIGFFKRIFKSKK